MSRLDRIVMTQRNFLWCVVLLLAFFPLDAAAQKRLGMFHRGAGTIEYIYYEPFERQPINLHYYIPTKGNIKNMQVIISMHGSERKGRIQRGLWRNLAEKFGFVVLVPEMRQENGYRNKSYRFGFVSRSLKNGEFSLRPREKWVFQLIEEIFDFYRAETGSRARQYDLFGQSAGAQFVERFLLTMHDARCRRAVASNAGQYTYPDPTGLHHDDGTLCDHPGWPHSVMDTPFANDEYLRAFFKRDFIVHIAANDRGDLLVRDKLNDLEKYKYNYYVIQGATRYDRAHNFFNYAKRIAAEKGMEFNWRLVVVPETKHGSLGAIFGTPNVRRWRLEDGDRVADIRDRTDYGAFHLLVEKK